MCKELKRKVTMDKFILPPPDTEYGYTAEFLKTILPDSSYSFFSTQWMNGRTVGFVDGKTVYYPNDLIKYILQVHGKQPVYDFH